LPHKAKKLYKFSNLYWVSRDEDFEPKILIAEKAKNNNFFLKYFFKGILIIVVIGKNLKNILDDH